MLARRRLVIVTARLILRSPAPADILALKSVRGANRPSGAVDDSDPPAEKTKVPVRNREARSRKRSSAANTSESKADRGELEAFSLGIVTLYCLDKKM
jgi:hypothetical protein